MVFNITFNNNLVMGRSGRDRMVVGFTTTCAMSAYHHENGEFEPRLWPLNRRYLSWWIISSRSVVRPVVNILTVT
jgi:hypothetical protein